jgi:NaMN:DMB phosphoribosyltransferase
MAFSRLSCHAVRKIAVVERALEVNRPDPTDPTNPLDVLGKVGELVGVILGGAAHGAVMMWRVMP